MALVKEETWLNIGATEGREAVSRKADRSRDDRDDDRYDELSEDEAEELELARYLKKMLATGVSARADYDTFDLAWDLYIGDHLPRGIARWKAKITINKIRALIHFMQAVMTDNKPRFTVSPLVPGTDEAATLLNKLCDRDWDENDVQDKLSLAVLYGLIWGTGVMKCTYDPRANGGRGAHITSAVVPYRIFFDPLATCVEDARFIIHIEPRSLGWLFENYPEKARALRKVRGQKIGTAQAGGEERDFIREGTRSYKGSTGQNPQTMSGPGIISTIDVQNASDPLKGGGERDTDWQDQIEVAEFWFRDETTEKYKRPKRVKGKVQFEDIEDEYGIPVLEQDGTRDVISEVDGTTISVPTYKAKQRVIMETATRPKYPNGRLAIMAGPLIITDVPNPYETPGFPFATWKNQDVGTFLGQGEPLALKDMNIGVDRIAGQIYDNLNLTGNPSFLVNKSAGVNMTTLRSRPGLIIPIDQMDGMKPLDVKPMPPQFMELINFLKGSIGEVAGLSDAMTSGAVPSNTAFATVDQLQESSSATLRQKVRNMERMIRRMGKLRIALIQQFDNGDRPLVETNENANLASPWTPIYEVPDDPLSQVIGVVPPPSTDTEVQFRRFSNMDLQGQVEFSVKPDSSLSTSPAGMWNKYMQLWDKKLIDLQSFHEKFEMDGWRNIVQRLQAMSAAGAPKKKPGPAPSPGAKLRSGPAGKQQAPSSTMASRHDLAATR